MGYLHIENLYRPAAQTILLFRECYSKKSTAHQRMWPGATANCTSSRESHDCFVVFDVKIGDTWLNVPSMDDVATKLGLEVVPWRKVSTDLSVLDAERDRPSEVAVRRGIAIPKPREGVVLRPLREFSVNGHSPRRGDGVAG